MCSTSAVCPCRIVRLTPIRTSPMSNQRSPEPGSASSLAQQPASQASFSMSDSAAQAVWSTKAANAIPMRNLSFTRHARSCAATVHFGVVPLHEDFGALERSEPELLVEAVRISSREDPAPQSLQVRMADHTFHEPLGEPSAAELRQDEHVAHVGDRRTIRYDAGETDLSLAVENGEAERALERLGDGGRRNSLRPVGRRQELGDHRKIELGRIAGNGEGVAAPVHMPGVLRRREAGLAFGAFDRSRALRRGLQRRLDAEPNEGALRLRLEEREILAIAPRERTSEPALGADGCVMD